MKKPYPSPAEWHASRRVASVYPCPEEAEFAARMADWEIYNKAQSPRIAIADSLSNAGGKDWFGNEGARRVYFNGNPAHGFYDAESGNFISQQVGLTNAEFERQMRALIGGAK